MKIDNPFDKRLEAQKGIPESMRGASVYLTDTLDLAWAAAQAVFEKHAKPEHALALLPMFIERAEVERQERLAAIRGRMAAEAAPPAARPAARKKAS